MLVTVDPGTKRGATETELPAPSVTTDTPNEGVMLDQIQLVEFSKIPKHSLYLFHWVQFMQEEPKTLPVRKIETPKWMKDFVSQ